MKRERIIVIKNPNLRRLRCNLRKILLEAVSHKYQELRKLRKVFDKKYGYKDPRAQMHVLDAIHIMDNLKMVVFSLEKKGYIF